MQEGFTPGSPGRLVTDFEKALMSSARAHMSWAELRGCYWHWKRSIRTNLGKHNLIGLLSNSPGFVTLVNLVYALPFVPEGEVFDTYQTIILEEVDDLKTNEADPFEGQEDKVTDFFGYMEKTW
jgi:hypothetical protein